MKNWIKRMTLWAAGILVFTGTAWAGTYNIPESNLHIDFGTVSFPAAFSGTMFISNMVAPGGSNFTFVAPESGTYNMEIKVGDGLGPETGITAKVGDGGIYSSEITIECGTAVAVSVTKGKRYQVRLLATQYGVHDSIIHPFTFSVYKPNTSEYTIRLLRNNSSMVTSRLEQSAETWTVVAEVGQSARLPKVYSEIGWVIPGYEFEYWYRHDGTVIRDLFSDGDRVTNLGPAGSVVTLYASWRNLLDLTPRYCVAFYKNDGSGDSESQWHRSGQNQALMGISDLNWSRPGYVFVGWSESSVASGADYLDGAVVRDIGTVGRVTRLYAVWRSNSLPSSHTVRYLGGRYGTGETLTDVKYDDVALALKGAVFTREGYVQVGWATSDGGVRVYDCGDVYLRNEAIDLYPCWERSAPTSYTLRFDGAGGAGTMGSQSGTYGVGLKLNANRFTRSGYRFTGWGWRADSGVTYQDGETITLTDVGTSEYRLYAQWAPDAVVVQPIYYVFNANGGKGTMQKQEIDTIGFNVLHVCTFTRKGFVFSGWALSPSGPVSHVDGASLVWHEQLDGRKDLQLYAVWTPAVLTVNFYANYEEHPGSVMTETREVGKKFGTLPTPPERTGYSFQGWYTMPGSAGEKLTASTIVDANWYSYYAHWQALFSKISVTLDPCGGNSTNPSSLEYAVGDSLATTYGSLPIPTHPDGCQFMGWFDAKVGGVRIGPDMLVREDVRRLYAHWQLGQGRSVDGYYAIDDGSYAAGVVDLPLLASGTFAASQGRGASLYGKSGALTFSVRESGTFDLYLPHANFEDRVVDLEGNKLSDVTSAANFVRVEILTSGGTSVAACDGGHCRVSLTAGVDYVLKITHVGWKISSGLPTVYWEKVDYAVQLGGEERVVPFMDAPTGVSASSNLLEGVRITWNPVPGAKLYKVYKWYIPPADKTASAYPYALGTAVDAEYLDCRFDAVEEEASGESARQPMLKVVNPMLDEDGAKPFEGTYHVVAVGEQGVSEASVLVSGTSPDCLVLSESSVDFESSGGMQVLHVSGNVDWNCSCDADWIVIDSAKSSLGVGDIRIDVLPNSGKTPRFGTVTVSGQEVAVSQKGAGDAVQVSFDTGDGERVPDRTYEADASYDSLPSARRTGYAFVRWKTGSGSDAGAVTVADKVSKDVPVLYADWKANVYEVRFVGNGATSGSMDSQWFEYGRHQVLSPNAFVRDGFVMVGWALGAKESACYGNEEEVCNLMAEPNGVVTLYAKWRRIGGIDPAELYPDDSEFSLSAANVYDGFVLDGDRVVGSVQVKTAKGSRDHVTGVLTATVTATVSCQGKKWSYSKGKVDASGQAAGLSCTAKGAPQLQVTLGENGLTGVWGDFVLSGSRNRFSDKTSDAARLLSETYQRSWTVCTELDGRTVPLQLLVQAKGVVKVTGTLPDGTKVSATTQLVLDEDGTAYVPVSVPLYKNIGSLSLLARIGESGAVELAGTDEWTRSDGKSVTGVSALALIEGGATEPPQTMGFTASANNTVGVQYDAQVVINGLGNPAKFTAKGLPAGLKIDAATGRITGVPSKTGTFAVGVTVAGSANSKWPKATDTVEIKIGELPTWAQGTFTGYSSDRRGDVALNGAASMTVSNVGKISGKMSVGGTNWTFSATGYSPDSESDAERFVVSAQAKAGKLTRDVQLTVAKAEGPDARLLNGKAEGDANGLPLVLWRTVWTDKSASAAAKEVLAGKTGVYTVQLTADCSPCGTGYLSLTIDAKGTVKASGKLADGTSVSASSPLFFDKGLGDFVILHLAPSAYKGGALFLPLVVSRDELGVMAAETPVAPSWTSFNAQATGVYGDGFVRGFDAVCGGWYNKLDTLRAYYETLAFRTESPELEYVHKTTDYDASHRKVTSQENRSVGAVDTLSQEGCRVTVLDNGKLKVAKKSTPVKDKTTGAYSYEGLNDGALTVSFTQATGIFKGSYTFWYDYESADDRTTGKTKQAHGSKSVRYEGIEVQGFGLNGFYLWDATGRYTDAKTKKEKTYKYKLSYPVSLTD